MSHYSVKSPRTSASNSSLQRQILSSQLDTKRTGRLQIHCKTDSDTYIVQTPGGFREVKKDVLQSSFAGEMLLLSFDFWDNIVPFVSRRKGKTASCTCPQSIGNMGNSSTERIVTHTYHCQEQNDPSIRIVAEGPRNDYFCWEEDKVRYFLVSIGDTTFQSSHHNMLKTWPGRFLLYEWPAYNETVLDHMWRDVKKPLRKLEKGVRHKIRSYKTRRGSFGDSETVDDRRSLSFDLFRKPSWSSSFLKRPSISSLGSEGVQVTAS
ncbi:hypothetical protein CFO_g2828 [Ceratocystis platani]|uniref:Uncharacterized protein n=1 Tax=Ceratocystis fimbriata f. sp. platani TaxID=88771 RepID=A0A0F8CVV5_CERFI|nr:hypothetical protein CFO_g2828 [Ceratocystis platani]